MVDFDKITRIGVGKNQVGIRGLEDVMEEMAVTFADSPDGETAEELLSRLSGRNYIPQSVRDDYADALLKEFRKKQGKPCAPDGATGMEIKVLGPGCALCDRLEMDIMDLLSSMNMAADLVHIRDMKEIAAHGVMGMPALIINGKVMCAGKNPPNATLAKWLREAASR